MTDFTPLSAAQLHQLFADLNPSRIENRTQGGAKLSYLAAWDIRASLTRVFGFAGWSAQLQTYEIHRIDEVAKSNGTGKNFRVLASAHVELRIHQTGAVYGEAGAASQTGADIGEATDFALKTAESDALKRCAINLGTTFGLSLYDSGSTQDVVRRTLAPDQVRTLREYAEEQRKAAEAALAETGANPQSGEVPDAAQPVDQANRMGDLGPDQSALDAATAAAARAFQR